MHRRSWGTAVLLPSLLLLAQVSPALADTPSAGFAAQSVFLSRSSITQGDSETAYTNIINNTDSLFEGAVVFSSGDTQIGAQPISLPAGEASVISITWEPDPGIHTITATLKNNAGTTLAQTSVKLTVASKIVPAPTSTPAQVESSTEIQSQIARLSPQIASATAPFFASVDNARKTVVHTFDAQIAKAQENIPGHAETVASSSPTAAPQSVWGWVMAFAWTLYFYVLTVLRAVTARIVYFYPIVALLFFYILYKIYKRMSRPKYRY